VGFVASAALGSLLGMQHAFEPDHLAAVATLMTGERTSAKAAWLGACWGLGHTLTLLVAGAALVVLRAEMPAAVTTAFELGVVLLLIAFGARAIYQAACGVLPRRTHTHAKPARSRLIDVDRWTLARPLLVGAVHGLAGSGALTALVVATLPSTATRLGYLALFGIGSTLGMVVLSGLLGWQIARMGSDRAVVRTFSLAVGCVSTVLGLFWGYPFVGRWI
jgi:high-affinity nickel-transport protein